MHCYAGDSTLDRRESTIKPEFGTAEQALADGADYLVVGRALTHCADIEAALNGLGFENGGE